MKQLHFTSLSGASEENCVQIQAFYYKSRLPVNRPSTYHSLLAPRGLFPAPVFLEEPAVECAVCYEHKRVRFPSDSKCTPYYYRIEPDRSPRRFIASTIRFSVREKARRRLVLYLLDFFHYGSSSGDFVYQHLPHVFADQSAIFVNYLDIFGVHAQIDEVCDEIGQILNFYRKPSCIVGEGLGAVIAYYLAAKMNTRYFAINPYSVKALRAASFALNCEEGSCSADELETLTNLANTQLARHWKLGHADTALNEALLDHKQLSKASLQRFTDELTCFGDRKLYRLSFSKRELANVQKALAYKYAAINEKTNGGLYVYSFHSPFLNAEDLSGKENFCYVAFCGHDLLVQGADTLGRILRQ